MNKGLLGLTAFLGVFLAGVAVAQMPAGPYHILHKEGAIYNSDTGWNTNTPPYYAGADWAVDFLYHSQGMSILHRHGAIWNETAGWDVSAYYAGIDCARAVEYLRDLTGCWCMRIGAVEFSEVSPGGQVSGEFFDVQYPVMAMEITVQIGTRLYGTLYIWEYDEQLGQWALEENGVEGTVLGDLVSLVHHGVTPEEEDAATLHGVVFWDTQDSCWTIEGSVANIGTDLDEGFGAFGNFVAWKGDCVCPPPQPPL